MSRTVRHIICCWLLFAVFIGGQAVQFVHQHERSTCCESSRKGIHDKKSEVKDCPVCDLIVNKKLGSPGNFTSWAENQFVVYNSEKQLFNYASQPSASFYGDVQLRGPPVDFVNSSFRRNEM